jgi:hypothetical protein
MKNDILVFPFINAPAPKDPHRRRGQFQFVQFELRYSYGRHDSVSGRRCPPIVRQRAFDRFGTALGTSSTEWLGIGR